MACSSAVTLAIAPSRTKEQALQEFTATVPQVRAYLLDLQARITQVLEGVEAQAGEGAAKFLADPWQKGAQERPQGDAITKILEN